MANDINLATLWVPVMPELSHFNEKMKEAGAGARAHIVEGVAGAEVGAGIGAQIGEGLLAGFHKSDVVGKFESAFGGINLATLGVAAGIAGVVLGTEKLVHALVDVGEEFIEINRSITLMTDQTGPGLDALKDHADKLVSTLDTGTRNLGADMATLSTRLNADASPALDTLVRHVEELRDRFGALDIDKLSGAFVQLGITSVPDADDALASLVQSARRGSESLNTLIGDMAKAGPVAKDLNIDVGQLGGLLVDLHKHGEDAGAGVDLLQRAMKAAKGEDFATFLEREIGIIEHYRDTGDLADAQQEAYLLSGTRKWEEFTDAGKAWLDVVQKGSDEYKAQPGYIDKTTDATKNLRNEWTRFSNELRTDMKPAADAVIDALTQILAFGSLILDKGGSPLPPPDYNIPSNAPSLPSILLPSTGPGATSPGASSPGGPQPVSPGSIPGVHTSGGSGTDWDGVASHESSGNWKANTGNGFYGGLQFDQPTWDAYKPPGAPARADLATKEQQIAAAEKRLAGPNGAAGGWPKTFHDHPDLFNRGGVGAGGLPGMLLPPLSNAPVAPSAFSTPMSSGGFGAAAGSPTVAPPDEMAMRQWAQSNFGLTEENNATHPYDGKWHHRGLGGSTVESGYAFDFTGSPQQMDAMANWIANTQSQNTLELIHQGAGFDPGREIKNTKFGDVYGADTNAEHRDHVHWATTMMPGGDAGPTQAYTAGWGEPLGSGGSPYVPGTGETEAQARARQRAIESAQDRVTSTNDAVDSAKSRLDDADAARNKANADVQHQRDMGVTSGQVFDDLMKTVGKTSQEYTVALHELTVALHAQKDAGEDLTEAQTKQSEEADKPPPHTRGGAGGGYSAAEQLGGGLLQGIMSSIGLPDVFGGKSPLDFGSVKLGMGLLNWGLSGLMGGAQNQQRTGAGAGFGAGLGSGIGLPGLGTFQPGGQAHSGGNFTIPPPGSPDPHGAGFVSSYTHIDNSMTVNGVPQGEHVAALQSMQNSAQRNEQKASAPGTFPVV